MRLIQLANGRGTALVDDVDYALVSQFCWFLSRGYALRGTRRADGGRSTQRMHQLLMGSRAGYEVDHINRDKLDNRRNNLRWATRSQQLANTGLRGGSSAYRGVSWDKSRSVWEARIRIDGKLHFLGCYREEAAAARAYDRAATELFGEFAQLNFPKLEEASYDD